MDCAYFFSAPMHIHAETDGRQQVNEQEHKRKCLFHYSEVISKLPFLYHSKKALLGFYVKKTKSLPFFHWKALRRDQRNIFIGSR
jgi:hypothetical protein